MTIFVTGGAGFIGSNFVIEWLKKNNELVINLDKLTYAGNIGNLAEIENENLHIFVKGDIKDPSLVNQLLTEYKPRALINFAAESHVDRSINNPESFIQTNIIGTFNLLEKAYHYWKELEKRSKDNFRFLHVSTDEVYGSLNFDDMPFTEATAYAPNSPYSASKASSDHLVRSYHHTYDLPTLTTNCSNNYGPYQFPEKFIPLIIYNALNHKSLPIYGDGKNIRDWLFVHDHCQAICRVLETGQPGQVYNISGLNEKSNLEIVNVVCKILDNIHPDSEGSYTRFITFVPDRPGHDLRYAINAHKIRNELGWTPVETFETGIEKTVKWYLDHLDWIEQIVSGDYQKWVMQNYGNRL